MSKIIRQPESLYVDEQPFTTCVPTFKLLTALVGAFESAENGFKQLSIRLVEFGSVSQSSMD